MMNLPKVRRHYEVVKTANEVFNKFYFEAYRDCVNFYDLHKSFFGTKKFSAEMQSEKIILCEINASLWVKAINSATDSITKLMYSHYVVVQKFINYVLNTESTENFGLIENYFWKLLFTHPPSPEMYDYYCQIIFDNFVCLNGKETEDQNLLFCLLKAVTNCLKVRTNADGNNDINKPAIRPKLLHKNASNFTNLDSQLSCLELRESLNIISNKSEAKVSQKQIYFNKLPEKEKIKRFLIILNFIYNILETDFIFWLNSKETKQFIDNRPLIWHLFWKNQRDFGSVNKKIQEVFHFYELTMNLDFQNFRIIHKLVILIGEIIRYGDSNEEIKYPFMGTNYNNYSRELSFILLKRLKDIKNNVKENKLIVNFKPPWLRLILCSHLLTSITKHECLPELTGAYDILKFIELQDNKNRSCKKTQTKSFGATKVLTQRRNEIKNINSRNGGGKKWTSRLENITPLMCAASQGHSKICSRLLLEPSENTNESNLTASESSHAPGVRRILKYYESNSVGTQNSFKDVSDFKKIVIKLCMEMIQAYFSTYKTWNINKALKELGKTAENNEIAFGTEFKCDYMRYNKDIKINIINLKNLLLKLECKEEFIGFNDIFKKIFFIK